jgi:hypothetical protein
MTQYLSTHTNYNKIIDELMKERTQVLGHIFQCGSSALLYAYEQQIKQIDKLIVEILLISHTNIGVHRSMSKVG